MTGEVMAVMTVYYPRYPLGYHHNSPLLIQEGLYPRAHITYSEGVNAGQRCKWDLGRGGQGAQGNSFREIWRVALEGQEDWALEGLSP